MGFGADVKRQNELAKARSLAVFRASAQEVYERANVPEAQGGKMPVKFGFLRNSIAASTSGMPGAGSSPPALVLLQVQLGDTVFVGWTAAYAMRQEYGFMDTDSLGRTYNQKGKGFLRSAVQQWTSIVSEKAAEVRVRIT